ncbi:2-phosphosulfolactate phosphatase [Bacillus alveayuensis]|jgi:2-phosphosulfolactate phosphatase|uniref:2-phosphosulfolactate phosphatase n=1 Tax=Aeribacillus alveayuensis TaxID=279215 RepID=UPI0005D1009D|nr:2-phosphosulfolactate phosphatase [Bacillus alveayuensis]
MQKIHLLLRKEEIDEEKMKDNKVAIVLDVLMATSMITAAISFSAKMVIPVLNDSEAKEVALSLPKDSYELVGEHEGLTIEGFLPPVPLMIKEKIVGKTVVLSTTNGTVAIRKSATAKKVYIGSLLNGSAVAEYVSKHHPSDTIVLICSGSSGQFSLEDFYGAGHILHHLLQNGFAKEGLSDSAKAALLFYERYSHPKEGKEILKLSQVGQMLTTYGFEKEIDYVSQQGITSVVPLFQSDGEIYDASKGRLPI